MNIIDPIIWLFIPVSVTTLWLINHYKLKQGKKKLADPDPIRVQADQPTVDLTPVTLSPKYLFLDLETTGLDAEKDNVLEVGAILTDSQFREITRYHAVVHADPAVLQGMPKRVRDMHAASGLDASCAASLMTVSGAFDGLAEVLESYGAKDLILSGNTIEFDHRFLKVHAPQIMPYLQYRLLNVTSLLMITEETVNAIPRPEKVAHRSMDDIERSLEVARMVRALVAVP